MGSINLAPTVFPVAARDFIAFRYFILKTQHTESQSPWPIELINTRLGSGFIVLGGPGTGLFQNAPGHLSVWSRLPTGP